MILSDPAENHVLHQLLLSLEQASAAAERIDMILAAARACLRMDIGFISEFSGDRRFFRHVDTCLEKPPLAVGDSMPLSEGYCQKIIEGDLPQLIPDTSAVQAAMALDITRTLPIGAHMSVPIRLHDGRIYGTFCCLSAKPDSSLTVRDLDIMRSFARFAAHELDRDMLEKGDLAQAAARVDAVLDARAYSTVYQPILRLSDGAVIGFEALTRFPMEPLRGPDVWFAEAFKAGRGVELELATVSAALAGLGSLPPTAYLSVNVSPETLLDARLADLLAAVPGERLVLEITEHADVGDYGAIARAVLPLRRRSIRIAVDDAGSGYASLRHVLRLKPDIIKLDIEFIRGVDNDPARRALASALVHFGHETGAAIVAEGIETQGERDTLERIGLDCGQGYHLCRPVPLRQLQEWLSEHDIAIKDGIGRTA